MTVIKQVWRRKISEWIASDLNLSHSSVQTILKARERICKAVKGSVHMRSAVIMRQWTGLIHENSESYPYVDGRSSIKNVPRRFLLFKRRLQFYLVLWREAPIKTTVKNLQQVPAGSRDSWKYSKIILFEWLEKQRLLMWKQNFRLMTIWMK